MEWKIGEIKQVNGEWYQCVEQPEKYDKTVCALCAFQGNGNCELDMCSGTYRSDKKSVIFKKLEKVGEPTMLDGKLVQKILTTDRYSCNGCCFESPECDKADNDLCCEHEIYVEIKQNKEDMEEKGQCCDNRFEIIAKAKEALLKETNIARDEKEMAVIDNILFRCWQMGWLDKYDDTEHSNSEKIGKNLKEFDLEAAKSGKPVCTRDGRKVRIICFDVKWSTHPIIALIEEGEDERLCSYMTNGRRYEDEEEWKDDLMMLPEKKSGWVNIYKETEGEYYMDKIIHKTEKFAFDVACPDDYIGTVKIEWYE